DLTHVLSPSHDEHDYSVSTGLSSVEGEVLPPSRPARLGTSATVTIAGRKIRSCKRYPFSYSSTTIFPEASCDSTWATAWLRDGSNVSPRLFTVRTPNFASVSRN